MRTLIGLLMLALAGTMVEAQWDQPNERAKIQNNARSFGRPHQGNPTLFFEVRSHDPSFSAFPARSFYKSRRNWRRIIDSTWGPGLPYASKVQIFNRYADTLRSLFDGFLSLGLNWDSLRATYRAKITDSTSRGGFAAIMGYFAMALRDAHTRARDTALFNTPLNPGIPILVLSGYTNVAHFGAVLTALPDSTLLVIRTVANHPLNLQPGDVVLGYEGQPWKSLVKELMAEELPVIGVWMGAPSAFGDGLLLGAGMNWHLFDTIDVKKASTGNILHLPVNPLITLPSAPMLNNEQLPIPGIPFPNYFSNQSVSYGIVPNTNVGYIYLYEENFTVTDNQFHQAYLALQGTDALIIDMRLNLGGWSFFPRSFAMMFNDSITTIEDAYRCSPTNYTLCPIGNSSTYVNPGQPPEQWEKPIALLLGPTCVSMGDVTAHRLRYHDMVKFFGKSCGASLGDNIQVLGFPGWSLWLSIGDMFHVVSPGVYLNRREFPVDYPAWFTSAGVAAGHDGVVDEALDWIQHVVYPHNVTTDRHWYRRNVDTLRLAARVENPDSHLVSSRVYIHSLPGTVIDSVNLASTSVPGGIEWRGTWPIPNFEQTFQLRITAKDALTGRLMSLRNAQRVTTKGPVVLDQVRTSRWGVSRNIYSIVPWFRNNGASQSVLNLSIRLRTRDSCVIALAPYTYNIPSIAVGAVDTSGYARVLVDTTIFPGYINLSWEIAEQGWPAWEDSVRVTVTGVELANGLPTQFALEQNYPNPFNPSTNIKYQIPNANHVALKVFDVLGREVATLVNDQRSPGTYKVQWDASGVASGVYLYRLQAGSFVETKKCVVLR